MAQCITTFIIMSNTKLIQMMISVNDQRWSCTKYHPQIFCFPFPFNHCLLGTLQKMHGDEAQMSKSSMCRVVKAVSEAVGRPTREEVGRTL